MIKETIYVAINHKDEIQWVRGSSKKTRYFKTDRYLKGAVEYHNKYHPNDIWKIRKCVILEDEPQTCDTCEQIGRCDRGRAIDCPIREPHTDCAWMKGE